MSNNIKETNATNELAVLPLGSTNEVENESECSCQCPVCQGFTPVAYINDRFSPHYEFPEDFNLSVYFDIYLTEVLCMDLKEVSLEDRQMILEEMKDEIGVIGFISECIDSLCDTLGIEWSAQVLSEDRREFNILCQLECDYFVPDEYIESNFPNFIFEEELTLQQKRYHSRWLGDGYALPLVDNFILGLCEELGVYVDTQFEDIR